MAAKVSAADISVTFAGTAMVSRHPGGTVTRPSIFDLLQTFPSRGSGDDGPSWVQNAGLAVGAEIPQNDVMFESVTALDALDNTSGLLVASIGTITMLYVTVHLAAEITYSNSDLILAACRYMLLMLPSTPNLTAHSMA